MLRSLLHPCQYLLATREALRAAGWLLMASNELKAQTEAVTDRRMWTTRSPPSFLRHLSFFDCQDPRSGKQLLMSREHAPFPNRPTLTRSRAGARASCDRIPSLPSWLSETCRHLSVFADALPCGRRQLQYSPVMQRQITGNPAGFQQLKEDKVPMRVECQTPGLLRDVLIASEAVNQGFSSDVQKPIQLTCKRGPRPPAGACGYEGGATHGRKGTG